MEFSTDDDDAEYEVLDWRLTENERCVLEILQEFPVLVLESEARLGRSFSTSNWVWGAKKKRSRPAGSADPAVTAPAPALTLGPGGPTDQSKAWTDASSPDTPLIASYSGGSSEPKSGSGAAVKRKSVKRTREELRLAETVAQKEKECLEAEIEKIRRRIELEKSRNRELKMTQKLLFPGQENEKAQWKKVNTCLTLGIHSPPPAEVLYSHVRVLGVREPMIPIQTAPGGADKAINFGATGAPPPSLKTPGVPSLTPDTSVVPDLNLPVEENSVNSPAPMGHLIPDSRCLSRAAAANARLRRYMINKAKHRR